MISEQTIKKIMNAVDIVEVIRDFQPDIHKAGNGYECLCPFHPDRRTGSFSVNPRKNMCYCFSCEKGGDAVYYLMEGRGMSYPDALRYLGRKYGIEVEGSEKFRNVPKAKPREFTIVPDNRPLITLPMSMYHRSTKGLLNDPLVKWICSHNWNTIQQARISKALRAYYVGTATTEHHEQFTIFWYLDEVGDLCTGKMIRYKYNGHRMKKEDGARNTTDWVHAWLFRSPKSPHYDRDKMDWKRTYFGMHLVDKFPNATINIVESEKTALIMSIAYGCLSETLWLACGSKTNLTRERLQPLIDRGRSIVLYPDRDGVERWKDTADAIGYRHLTVNTDPVKRWWIAEDGEHADIADVVLRMIDSHEPDKTILDSPAVRELIQRLNLELYGK